MEEIKNEIINTIENFSLYFGREYKECNFFLKFSEYFSEFNQLDQIWDIKMNEPKKSNKINEKKLIDINDKIFKYYDYLLKKYNYSSTNREEFDYMISNIFLLLSNIYDLYPNFLEIYFKNDWLSLHLKLLNVCLDENDPPEPTIGFNKREKISVLSEFALFFCLCLSKDTDFNTRLYLLLKYPELFYKIAIIIAGNTHFCCCGHGMSYQDEINLCSNIKLMLLIFETFKYIDDNNINYEAAKNTKIKIFEFYFIHIGKNCCIVYLYRMGKMLKNDDMFNHIINTTNLLIDALTKEKNDNFSHAIDGFEAFMNLCENPDYLFKILNIISPPEGGLKNRIYREILKKISIIISNNNQIEYLENKLYNDAIFQKLLETLKKDTYIGDYEGIWQILLDSSNINIVTIFYKMKNKYKIGEIMFKQVDSLIKNNLVGYRLNAVVRIMNLFLKMGSEIKKKFNVENYYIDQFKDCYKKIGDLDIQDNKDEDIDEFKNYFKNK